MKAAAGFSLGEYSALVYGNAMSFETGLRIVKARAEAMDTAAKMEDSGMASISGVDDKTLLQMIAQATAETEGDGKAYIANYMFPEGRTCSGDKAVLEEACKLCTAAGAKSAKMLAVSGAFHTKRMESAKEALEKALSEVTFNAPRANVAIYSNVTGLPMTAKDADGVRASLATQLVSPVMWEQTLKNLIGDGKTKFFELGPNSQIKSMTKRVSLDVWREMKGVQA